MSNGDLGNGQSVVLINQHEPEGETTQRLLEIAREKGYPDTAVQAQRGEHDVALSWRVPTDVAEEFDKDRGDRWPGAEAYEVPPPAALNEDAYAADHARAAQAAAQAEADGASDDTTSDDSKVRKDRPSKAKE